MIYITILIFYFLINYLDKKYLKIKEITYIRRGEDLYTEKEYKKLNLK